VGRVQEAPVVVAGTIRGTVGFALDGDGRDRVEWAVHAAGLTRDLEGMPAGLDTIVGERGVTLSGGQKQRVALARVLVRAPQVVVLDDALSSVDAATEREMLDRLREFF